MKSGTAADHQNSLVTFLATAASWNRRKWKAGALCILTSSYGSIEPSNTGRALDLVAHTVLTLRATENCEWAHRLDPEMSERRCLSLKMGPAPLWCAANFLRCAADGLEWAPAALLRIAADDLKL
jgi:hypothetical protein